MNTEKKFSIIGLTQDELAAGQLLFNVIRDSPDQAAELISWLVAASEGKATVISAPLRQQSRTGSSLSRRVLNQIRLNNGSPLFDRRVQMKSNVLRRE